MMILGCPFMFISGTKADQKPLNKWASMGGTLGVNIFVFSLGRAKFPEEDSSSSLPEFYRSGCQWLGAEQRKETKLADFHSSLFSMASHPHFHSCASYTSGFTRSQPTCWKGPESISVHILFSSFLKKQLCKNVQALLSSQLCKNSLQGWTWPASYSLPTPSLHCDAVQNGSY